MPCGVAVPPSPDDACPHICLSAQVDVKRHLTIPSNLNVFILAWFRSRSPSVSASASVLFCPSALTLNLASPSFPLNPRSVLRSVPQIKRVRISSAWPTVCSPSPSPSPFPSLCRPLLASYHIIPIKATIHRTSLTLRRLIPSVFHSELGLVDFAQLCSPRHASLLSRLGKQATSANRNDGRQRQRRAC